MQGETVIAYLVKLIGTSALLTLIVIYVSDQPHAGLEVGLGEALRLITG